MAPPSSILLLLIIILVIFLRANSQYNSSFERTLLSSLNQHWGYPFPLYEAWHLNSSSSPCDWPYVDCNDDHMVTALSLSQKDISGTIPSSICQLKHLVSIDLSGNDITGPIPAGIGDCTSLQSLDLSWNHISGAIPGELFLMKHLVTLSLRGNRLHVSLERLDLSTNYDLNGSIPDGITYLHNLQRLDLSNNSFSGEIPTRMFSIPRLQYLSLSYNDLSGHLTSYTDVKSLRFLSLAHNRLSGPILKILLGEINKTDISRRHLDLSHNLARLTTVYLCHNNFSGMIPYKFQNDYLEDSCLDASNLCSEEGTSQSFPSCPSSLCSYVIFHGHKMCATPTLKNSYVIFITVLGIGAGGFALLFYLARKCKKDLKSSPPMKDELEWKMISFQSLKFETTDILTSLTDDNLIGRGGSGKVYRVFTHR